MEDPSSEADPNNFGKLRRHVRILFEVGRLIGERTSLDRFLDHAVVQVARAIEIDHVKVMRYRRQTGDLVMSAGMGWKDGVVRVATFSADLRSPAGWSFQTAEPVVISDVSAAAEFAIPDVLREHGIVSLANVPILIDGAAWGVLEVDSSSRREFDQDTIDFMAAAAAFIGAAVQRRSFEQSETNALAEVAAEVQHRDLLLREMQHRVKNNFQIILASISLQKRRFENPEVQRALDHVANRINAISLAHDQLAPRPDMPVVNMAAYLRALCASIEQQADEVAIETELDQVELSIDRAVPLGLILNEASMNSLKHAFRHRGGRITVRLQAGVGYGEARLTIADNGRGMKEPATSGSGLKLIASLARQIGGDLEQHSSERGTSISVVFPVIS